MSKTKSFNICKKRVFESWKNVKANKGTWGVDKESIKDFESNLKGNLYKVWNRMSSGSYFPCPTKVVDIPKADGSLRRLGIPTVKDRIAQGVVKGILEPKLEEHFHEDSYGYRPKRSALDALGKTRVRCWRYDWCIDLDIKQFFDNIDHELLMKAVRKHVQEKWILLYINRWLKTPIEYKEGKIEEREQGTPQGGVLSPLLANLFMHYAFDVWINRKFKEVKFERYADDVIIHCKTKQRAEEVLEGIKIRLRECGLEVHPDKTKIVYCKDATRKGSYEEEKFDFLGYTFRPRKSMNKRGNIFVNFTPGISPQAGKGIRKKIRNWKIHQKSGTELKELARKYNTYFRGWINYYGRYNKSEVYRSLKRMEYYLVKWVKRKYKRFRRKTARAKEWLSRRRREEPNLFVHWKLGLGSLIG